MEYSSRVLISIGFLIVLIAKVAEFSSSTHTSAIVKLSASTKISPTNLHSSSHVKSTKMPSSSHSTPINKTPTASSEPKPFYTSEEDIKEPFKDQVTVFYDESDISIASLIIYLNAQRTFVPVGRIYPYDLDTNQTTTPDSIKIYIQHYDIITNEECNGGTVGASVTFGASYCGFSYAWSSYKSKFLFTIRNGNTKEHGESTMIDNKREFAIEWRRNEGMVQVVQGFDNTVVFTSKLDCFPIYPRESDWNKKDPKILPFSVFVDTATPNCGMTLEMKNGYVILRDIPVPTFPPLSTHSPVDANSTIDPSKSPYDLNSTTAGPTKTGSSDKKAGSSGLDTDYWILIIIGIVLLVLIIIFLVLNILVCLSNRKIAAENAKAE